MMRSPVKAGPRTTYDMEAAFEAPPAWSRARTSGWGGVGIPRFPPAWPEDLRDQCLPSVL